MIHLTKRVENLEICIHNSRMKQENRIKMEVNSQFNAVYSVNKNGGYLLNDIKIFIFLEASEAGV